MSLWLITLDNLRTSLQLENAMIKTNYHFLSSMDKQNPQSNAESDNLMEELDAKWDALENDPEFRKKPFWQRIVEIGNVVPQSEWRKHFPRDFARNAEHYMYGAPREDEEE